MAYENQLPPCEVQTLLPPEQMPGHTCSPLVGPLGPQAGSLSSRSPRLLPGHAQTLSPSPGLLTLWSWLSTPGLSMMRDTRTLRKRKNVKMRRVMVELRLEGQHPHRMQGAEPQRQEACGEGRTAPLSLPPLPAMPAHAAPTTAPSMPPDLHRASVIPHNFQA